MSQHPIIASLRSAIAADDEWTTPQTKQRIEDAARSLLRQLDTEQAAIAEMTRQQISREMLRQAFGPATD